MSLAKVIDRSITRSAVRIATLALVAFAPFLLVQAGTAAASSRVLGSGGMEDPPVIHVLSNRSDGVEMQFELPALRVDDLPAANGEVFQGLSIPQGGENGEVGQPMLPVFGRLVQIPDRSDVRIETVVEQSDEYDGIRVVPMQAEEGGFAYDAAAYSRDDYGATPAARIGGPALMRGMRVVPLTFSPVQYNPAEDRIRVARRVHVSVHFEGENLVNAGRPDKRPIATSFDQLYRELIVNYDNGGRAVRPGCWLVICPNNTTVINDLQPLVAWRNRKGLPAQLVTTAVTGTTNTAIKNYLLNAYNNWDPPLEYIVLAGDASGSYNIPTWFESQSGYNGEGDHPYTQLDGTDVLSDAHLGRLSFNSTSELETEVAKIIGYESAPYLAQDPDWFTRACLVGDPAHGEASCPLVMQWAKTRLLHLGYTDVDTVFSGNFVSQMTTYLNLGDTVFSYRGYLGMSGWTSGNVASMTNGWKLPFAVISTCGTGSFASETSISESFLRAGTATSPKGAIAATGTATWGTHTRFNNCYVIGVLGGLLDENLWTTGAAHTRGKTELYIEYGGTSQDGYVYIFSHWNNLMGDPATEVWTGYPAAMSADYPTTVSVGCNAVTVSVTELSMPVPGAQVCLWKGSETYVVGLTDAQGRCELPVSLATAGNMLVTVSKHNHQTVQGTIAVTVPNVFVGYESSAVQDSGTPPSAGNDDGRINPGETIALPVQLENFGTQTATGVSAVLSTDDPDITVQSGPVAYGDIAAGASAWGDPFIFSVDLGCPHGHTIRLNLDVSCGSDVYHSILDLPVYSTNLLYRELHFYNAGENGILDPSETVGLSIALSNKGGLDALTPSAQLFSMSEWVNVVQGQSSYPTIPIGGQGENDASPFIVHANPFCMRGYMAPMVLVLTMADGIRDSVLVSVPVGTRSDSDPTGPDHYGYYAYDDRDLGYPQHATYNWVEIDPAYGGSGTEIVLGDYGDNQDKTRVVDLPFTFKYYGNSYTQASVCSNGWIVMGQTYLVNYCNYTIPSLGGPNGVIAPFWDDLQQTSTVGKCYQKYDAANHRWIVEWSHFRNAVGGATETFEAMFYDPSQVPTDTGDGIIEFQYNTFNNVDTLDGYATVGIEQPENAGGLLFTYFNLYTPGSVNLGSGGHAIRFVPTREEITAAPEGGRPLALSLACTNPMRPGASLAFTLDRTGPVKLSVFDLAGREVRRLFDGPLGAGSHAARWDGLDDRGCALASGTYFYRLSTAEKTVTRKAILVR